MSGTVSTGSGLIWHKQTRRVRQLDGPPAKVKFANIRRLPASGLFAEELAALDPSTQAVSIEVASKVDLTGLESLPKLVDLIIFGCQGFSSDTVLSPEALKLTRILMPYAEGMTEQLVASPHLHEVEVERGTLDMLKGLSDSVRKICLRKVKSAADPTIWDKLSHVGEFEIVQSGKIELVAPKDAWPNAVNFTLVSSVEGLVQASKIQPLNNLGLEGIRTFDPGESLWDLQAKSAFINFNSRPPRWLIEAWNDRPEDWANRFSLPEHRLLPGSEDQEWEFWSDE